MNWVTLKERSFATKSCGKLVQSFNRSNEFRASTLMGCRTSYRYFCNTDIISMLSTFAGASGVISVLPVTIFPVFSSRDNIFCFRSSRTLFCRKRLFSVILNSFPSSFFFTYLFLSTWLSIADNIPYTGFQ